MRSEVRSRTRLQVLALVAVLLFAGAVGARADTAYNNSASANTAIYPFGNPNSATYGETFSAPTNGDTQLNSFSLFLSPYGSGPIQFAGYVATWNGSEIGSVLYSSSQITYNQSGTQQFTFAPDVNLTAGGEYVAFLSVTSGYNSSSAGEAEMPGVSSGGTIPGGQFVFQNNSGDFAALSTSAWRTWSVPDAEFQADFSSPTPVPEPSSLILLGSGGLGLFGVIRRKVRS
jgi:hypothetical protein